jgi:hypothetical protein
MRWTRGAARHSRTPLPPCGPPGKGLQGFPGWIPAATQDRADERIAPRHRPAEAIGAEAPAKPLLEQNCQSRRVFRHWSQRHLRAMDLRRSASYSPCRWRRGSCGPGQTGFRTDPAATAFKLCRKTMKAASRVPPPAGQPFRSIGCHLRRARKSAPRRKAGAHQEREAAPKGGRPLRRNWKTRRPGSPERDRSAFARPDRTSPKGRPGR